ncbi:retrovirus-related pol polyprotein from transposon TNT 1-94 [Tanacetum coccineum]
MAENRYLPFYIFGALCYPKNNREDIGKLGAKGFIDADHPSHVYKLKKALYGLKQAPREVQMNSMFSPTEHFFKGTFDPTLFYKTLDDDILVVQVYVDDIIFGSTHPRLSQPRSTSRRLKGSFVISGEPLIRVFGIRRICIELTDFSADYADVKTPQEYFRGAQCLSEKFVLCDADTVNGLWLSLQQVSIYCDSKSAIAISCNPVQHSRTKHIAIRYHFIKEHVEKGTIELYFVKTDYQLADLFTKALPLTIQPIWFVLGSAVYLLKN